MVSVGFAHVPFTQNVLHVWSCVHAVPVPLHVSVVLPLQRFSPGVHAPVQSPWSHATRHDCTFSHAVPVELHTCVCSPEHRRVPATQVVAPVHAFACASQLCAHTCCVIH